MTMNRELLEQPFDQSLVKTRKGAWGQQIAYVEASAYIHRLNEVFDSAWSFEILEHHIHDAEVVVLGKLSAGGVIKAAFGGSAITVKNETGERLSLADDLKAAATDSLKKAASLLGIGLYLYSDPAPAPTNGNGKPQNGNSSKPQGSSNGNGGAPTGDRLTQKQLALLWRLGRKLNLSAEDIRARSVQLFGVAPEFLKRADASALIGDWMDELGGEPD